MNRPRSLKLVLGLLLAIFMIFGIFYAVNGRISKHYNQEVVRTIGHLTTHATHTGNLNQMTQFMLSSVHELILKRKLLKDVPDHHNPTLKDRKVFWEETIHAAFHDNYNEAVAVTKKMKGFVKDEEDSALLSKHLENLRSFKDIGHQIISRIDSLKPMALDRELARLREKGYELDNGIRYHHKFHLKEFENSREHLKRARVTVSMYLAFSYAIAALVVFLAIYVVLAALGKKRA